MASQIFTIYQNKRDQKNVLIKYKGKMHLRKNINVWDMSALYTEFTQIDAGATPLTQARVNSIFPQYKYIKQVSF